MGEGVLTFHRCELREQWVLSADGLHKIVKHSLLREQFKVIKNSEYRWQDSIMSGLAVFGFKMTEREFIVEFFMGRCLYDGCCVFYFSLSEPSS